MSEEKIKTAEEYRSITIKELMEAFNTSEGLEKLLSSLEEMFRKVEYNGYLWRKGQVNTSEAIHRVMDYAKGVHTMLAKIAGLAEKEYGVQEARFLLEAKNKVDEKGKGMTDTAATAYAKEQAALWRRAAGILSGYLDTCKHDIMVCQTKLKQFSVEEETKPAIEEDII